MKRQYLVLDRSVRGFERLIASTYAGVGIYNRTNARYETADRIYTLVRVLERMTPYNKLETNVMIHQDRNPLSIEGTRYVLDVFPYVCFYSDEDYTH